MRRSHRRMKACMQTRVLLNGVDVSRDCQMADDRQGVALLFVRDEAGRPIVSYARGGAQLVKRLAHGKVRIERKP
jgi:hypothetical protein